MYSLQMRALKKPHSSTNCSQVAIMVYISCKYSNMKLHLLASYDSDVANPLTYFSPAPADTETSGESNKEILGT